MSPRPLAALAVALVVATAVPLSTTEAEPTHVLNVGTAAPENTPWADQIRDTERRIEQESGGAVEVRAFLGGALGSEIEMVRDIRRGERLQAGGISTGALSEGAGVPLLVLPELPFLFRNDQEADTILDEVLYEPVAQALDRKGFTMGFWAINGWRHFFTKGGPATTPEELARYKMRSQESQVHLDFWKALGVQAVPKPVTEVVSAVNTGIVDGFDNTILFALAAGWAEPMTHVTLSAHIFQPAAVVFSKRFMKSLPPDLQRVVIGDPLAQARDGRAAVRALEAELLQTLKEMGKTVVELTPEQRKVFADRTAVVHQQFLQAHPDLKPIYDQVQARLAQMR